MTPNCLRCRAAVTDRDYFEDGVTRPYVVLDGDVDPEVTEGPFCLPCFHVRVGLVSTDAPSAPDHREVVATLRRLEFAGIPVNAGLEVAVADLINRWTLAGRPGHFPS